MSFLIKLKQFIKKENSNIFKLNKLLKCISEIKIDKESIFIKFDRNLIVYNKGHQIFCSEGNIIINGNQLHLNPNPNCQINQEYIQHINKLKCQKEK